MNKRYFCIKVILKHHLTSPIFGGVFKRIYQMVAVQIWPYNLGKPFFKKIKIKQINYVISSTNKRKVFLERLNKSKNIFEKFSLLGENSIITREKKVQK